MVDLRATNDKLTDRAARIICAACEVDRARAFELLDLADQRVKHAIVMQGLSVDFSKAESLLINAEGHLSRVIGDPK